MSKISKKTKIKMYASSVDRLLSEYTQLIVCPYGIKKIKEERSIMLARVNTAMFLLKEELKDY